MAQAQITTSSTAEYFAKNLQQVGFSSPTKAVLTTLKEAVDNSLDACEMAGIKPEIIVEIKKIGTGAQKNTDLIYIMVEDNGPGIDGEHLAMVYGEYLASSKFGKGQCSRGQQGIGISAATTWAQLTNATGVSVVSKTEKMKKAISAVVDVDIKKNKGVIRNKEMIEWKKDHGVKVEFKLDGRIQLNGEGGILTYLDGTTLVNPHVTLKYKLLDEEWVTIERVSDDVPPIPPATNPHPHTMKLGEFITHAHLYGKMSCSKWLKTGFTRVSDATLKDFVTNGLPKKLLDSSVSQMSENDLKAVYTAIQKTDLISPSTKSVLSVGEEPLAKSIGRIGQVDFFSVVTRKPRICDFKPVVVEVALARFLNRGNEDEPVQVLRFANRVPLQFDKAACAITKSIESVNWRAYGLNQPKNSVPMGPYVFAISVVSPFIKFKNASKETIDASDDLVEELRRALMQAGQKLSRHIRREVKAEDLERKIRHIEQFGPMLVDGLVRITSANAARKKKAEEGLRTLLGRDAQDAEAQLEEADTKLKKMKAKSGEYDEDPNVDVIDVHELSEEVAEGKSTTKGAKAAKEKAQASKPTKGEKAPKTEKAAKSGTKKVTKKKK
ncbi:MAG: DNA topoisomerase VI subunit B [Bdellovibrionota bacterium]